MQQSEVVANPFALMMNPEAVIAAVNRSDRLMRLKSRICRPLDKPVPVPLVPGVHANDSDAAADEQGAEGDAGEA